MLCGIAGHNEETRGRRVQFPSGKSCPKREYNRRARQWGPAYLSARFALPRRILIHAKARHSWADGRPVDVSPRSSSACGNGARGGCGCGCGCGYGGGGGGGAGDGVVAAAAAAARARPSERQRDCGMELVVGAGAGMCAERPRGVRLFLGLGTRLANARETKSASSIYEEPPSTRSLALVARIEFRTVSNDAQGSLLLCAHPFTTCPVCARARARLRLEEGARRVRGGCEEGARWEPPGARRRAADGGRKKTVPQTRRSEVAWE
jgi:hypothetical protein